MLCDFCLEAVTAWSVPPHACCVSGLFLLLLMLCSNRWKASRHQEGATKANACRCVSDEQMTDMTVCYCCTSFPLPAKSDQPHSSCWYGSRPRSQGACDIMVYTQPTNNSSPCNLDISPTPHAHVEFDRSFPWTCARLLYHVVAVYIYKYIYAAVFHGACFSDRQRNYCDRPSQD